MTCVSHVANGFVGEFRSPQLRQAIFELPDS
jgi:hypothetical protein